jgi:hypothetical protein
VAALLRLMLVIRKEGIVPHAWCQEGGGVLRHIPCIREDGLAPHAYYMEGGFWATFLV